MIKIETLQVRQGDFLLDQIDMKVPRGEYAMLMGPTGCGKTTLLESICGLRRICEGRILIGDQDVTRLAPAHRQIGYVPQDAALFPTMRIDHQIGFALEVRRVPQPQRGVRVEELADLLEITPLLGRYPRGLSGGERQRVALARALSFRPRLLCLDEPLSALDGETKNRLTGLLKTVHQNEAVTVLHITHNATEVAELGTLSFHFENGRVVES